MSSQGDAGLAPRARRRWGAHCIANVLSRCHASCVPCRACQVMSYHAVNAVVLGLYLVEMQALHHQMREDTAGQVPHRTLPRSFLASIVVVASSSPAVPQSVPQSRSHVPTHRRPPLEPATGLSTIRRHRRLQVGSLALAFQGLLRSPDQSRPEPPPASIPRPFTRNTPRPLRGRFCPVQVVSRSGHLLSEVTVDLLSSARHARPARVL